MAALENFALETDNLMAKSGVLHRLKFVLLFISLCCWFIAMAVSSGSQQEITFILLAFSLQVVSFVAAKQRQLLRDKGHELYAACLLARAGTKEIDHKHAAEIELLVLDGRILRWLLMMGAAVDKLWDRVAGKEKNNTNKGPNVSPIDLIEEVRENAYWNTFLYNRLFVFYISSFLVGSFVLAIVVITWMSYASGPDDIWTAKAVMSIMSLTILYEFADEMFAYYRLSGEMRAVFQSASENRQGCIVDKLDLFYRYLNLIANAPPVYTHIYARYNAKLSESWSQLHNPTVQTKNTCLCTRCAMSVK